MRYALLLRELHTAQSRPAARAILESLAQDEHPEAVRIDGFDAMVLPAVDAHVLQAVASLLDLRISVYEEDGGAWRRTTAAPEVPDTPDEEPVVDVGDAPRVDREFAQLCGALPAGQREALRASIMQHGCREPLAVWAEQEILLDGHNRLSICEELRVGFARVEYSFPDRDAARAWVIDNALMRRELPPARRRYLRGLRLLTERKDPAATQLSGSRLPQVEGAGGETAALIAKREGVSRATVERDAQYARAVDQLASSVGPKARTLLLSGDLRMTPARVIAAAATTPRTIDEMLVLRACATPREPMLDLVAHARRFVAAADELTQSPPCAVDGRVFDAIRAARAAGDRVEAELLSRLSAASAPAASREVARSA